MTLRKSLVLVCSFLTLSVFASAQIKAVEQFLKDNENLSKYFIYQSTLRMLNQSGDPDFNKLIKGIRKINVYIAEDDTTGISSTSYQQMIKDLANEQFETLMSAKQDRTLINLMTRESGDNAYYVLTALDDTDFALLEMDGQLDLRYLQALEDVDFMKLRKMVGQETGGSNSEDTHD